MVLAKKPIEADRNLLTQLVPPGHALRTDDAPVQRSFWYGCADGLKRLRDYITDLALEGDPLKATLTVDDWMAWFSLPLKYLPPPADIAAKRAQLKMRIPRGIQHNPATFVALAASLGYTVSITAGVAAEYGIAECGDELLGLSDAYTWYIITTEVPASAGALAIEALFWELHHFHMTFIYDHQG